MSFQLIQSYFFRKTVKKLFEWGFIYMRILKIDRKENVLEIVPDSLDDLWHLEKIIEKGDLVSGHTNRKIKGKNEGDEARRINLFLKLQVENVEFDKFFGLRVNGIILEGHPEEFIEQKAYHTLEIAVGEKIKIQKKELKNYQIERLEKAKAASARNAVLILIMDDELALFSMLKDFGVEEKCVIQSKIQGKQFDESSAQEKKYFEDLLEKINEIKCEKAIIAGPGFAKGNFQKFLQQNKPKHKIEFFFESTNSVGVTGLNELVKSNAIEKIVKEMEIVKESKLVEKVFEFLGKDSKLVVYGFNEVKKAVDFGAVETLIVTDKILSSEKRHDIENLMDLAEKSRGKVEIIAEQNDAGRKLQAIGGIAAILRYPLN